MKICHVLNQFLPYHTAGTEVYAWALSKQLQQRGIEIEIIIPNYGQTSSVDYMYDGLKVFQYAEPTIVDRSLVMGFRKPDGLSAFEDHLAEERPDIVHFHELAGSNGIGLHHVAAAKKMGAKVMMTFHLAGYTCRTGTLIFRDEVFCDGLIDIRKCSNCYLHSRGNSAMEPLLLAASSMLYKFRINTMKWNNKMGTAVGTAFIIDGLKKNFEALVEQCDKLVVLTRWYKEILILNGVPEEKISYVAQGLPFDSMVPPSTAKAEARSPLRLMFLGRIDPLKGLHLLIEALRDIPEDKIELDIYGENGGSDYEREWRNKTEGSKQINWKGRLAQKDVVTTMQEYDALCVCSTFSEMSPLVIQEAFAAGIPVIASNVYGNAEQIRHDHNGILFRYKDVASLREQLFRCIADSSILLQIRKNISPPRSFQQVGDDYVNIYQTLIA